MSTSDDNSSSPKVAIPNTKIGYAEFGDWYDSFRADVLEPALETAELSLERALRELLSDRDLARIRSTSGRVKSKRRTWRKIQHPRYENQITKLDDVARVIDDLVGLRVTCVNRRDIDVIQTALDALPRKAGRGLWLDPDSERDYVAEPKESGYRGWHVNLGVVVDGTPVACELQVRTLLQDSWGELTHEETYSKDGALPPLVDVLSSRMADILSVLDDIAEDLRTELDRIDQETVAESDDPLAVADHTSAGQAADAAALLRARWSSITRPTDLAGLAWALQREFGAEISDDWFGHGSFKRFLRHAIPDGEISSGRQAYLLPVVDLAEEKAAVSASPNDSDHDPELGRPTPPGPARQLRRIDPGFPLLTEADWPIVFEYLAESWRRVKPLDSTASTVKRLTTSTRDLARGGDASVSRRTLDYVVKALLAIDETQAADTVPPNAQLLAERFAEQTVQRMVELRIIEGPASKAATQVTRWVTGAVDQ